MYNFTAVPRCICKQAISTAYTIHKVQQAPVRRTSLTDKYGLNSRLAHWICSPLPTLVCAMQCVQAERLQLLCLLVLSVGYAPAAHSCSHRCIRLHTATDLHSLQNSDVPGGYAGAAHKLLGHMTWEICSWCTYTTAAVPCMHSAAIAWWRQ